jgi:hypothetical protein
VVTINVDDINSLNWMALIPKWYPRPYLLVATVQYYKKKLYEWQKYVQSLYELKQPNRDVNLLIACILFLQLCP